MWRDRHACVCLTTLSPAARPSFHPQCLQMKALPVNWENKPWLWDSTSRWFNGNEGSAFFFYCLNSNNRETGCFVAKTATENVTVMPQATWRADSPLRQQICKWMQRKYYTSTPTGMWLKHILRYSDKNCFGCLWLQMFHGAHGAGSSCSGEDRKNEGRDCERSIIFLHLTCNTSLWALHHWRQSQSLSE